MTSAWQSLLDAFALSGVVTPLPSERCRTALLQSPSDRFVLKLHPAEQEAGVRAETAVLQQLARQPGIPQVVTSPDGQALVDVQWDGGPGLARVLTWLPGVPWSQAWAPGAPAPAATLADLGRLVARVDGALAPIDHPDAGDGLRWNLLHAAQARDLLPEVPDPERRALAAAVLDRFAGHVQPRLAELPVQLIHNDASDGNVLVGDDGQVAGLIDFGDLCRAPRVCGLAVACAYAMFDRPDPVAAVLPLVAGYHEVAPLTPVTRQSTASGN